MSKYEHILYEQSGPIVKITLNRPEKLNAIDDLMAKSLTEALEAIEFDSSVRVLIITGAGRAFSAGYDISPRDKPLETMQDWRNHAVYECLPASGDGDFCSGPVGSLLVCGTA